MTKSPSLWSQLGGIFGLSSPSSPSQTEGRPAPQNAPKAQDGRVPEEVASQSHYECVDVASTSGSVEHEASDQGGGIPEQVSPGVHDDLAAPAGQRELAALIRSLSQRGDYQQAAELCERHFGEHRDARDEWNHPIYYKEMLRICIAKSQYGSAMDLAEKLGPLLAPEDPCIQLFYARKYVAIGDYGSARGSYTEALARAPRNTEALEWLAQYAESAA